MTRILMCLVILLVPLHSEAHKPSDSYLILQADGPALRGQWDIALRDLEHAIGLDGNGDGEITWGELKTRQGAIAAYALSRLKIRANGHLCAPAATAHLVDNHSDGAYAVLRFDADCGTQEVRSVEIEYRLFFDLDPTHRGLLRWQSGGVTTTAVLGPDRPGIRVVAGDTSRLAQFLTFAREGVWHIWIGLDHILFLISLLLPAVFTMHRTGWVPLDRVEPAFWDVFKVVTAFTAAHSITLSLAALSVVNLPSRVVETAIAFSVLLAALNNVRPTVHGRRWMAAFGFGLIHGFGFASVLADLGLPQGALVLALVGFNLGVEAGQLCIVSGFLPVAFWLRRTVLYRRIIFIGGSALIAAVALAWMAERWFDLKLFVW